MKTNTLMKLGCSKVCHLHNEGPRKKNSIHLNMEMMKFVVIG